MQGPTVCQVMSTGCGRSAPIQGSMCTMQAPHDVMAVHVQGLSLIRVLRIASPECTPPQAWVGHSTCLETATASLALAVVHLSNDVLQRPLVSCSSVTYNGVLRMHVPLIWKAETCMAA
jgi:hypothetical protein